MSEVVVVTAKRTFWNMFSAFARLWFDGPSGYFSVFFVVGLFTYLSYQGSPLWLGISMGVAWLLVMLPLLFAMRAWQTMRLTRRMGQPVFTFDANGATCRFGEMETRVPWSGVHRVKITRTTFCFFVTQRVAWLLGRDALGPGDERAILAFSRAANVRLPGEKEAR